MIKGVNLSIKTSDRSHNEWKLKPGKLKWKIKVHFNISVDYAQKANANTCTSNVHASSHQSKKHSSVKTNSLTALKYGKSCRRKQWMETSRSAGLCKSTVTLHKSRTVGWCGLGEQLMRRMRTCRSPSHCSPKPSNKTKLNNKAFTVSSSPSLSPFTAHQLSCVRKVFPIYPAKKYSFCLLRNIH